MRRIAVVTVGRSDFGIYLPVLELLREDPTVELQLMVGGAHLAPQFGWTVSEIEAHGFQIAHRVDALLAADTPEAISKSMGLGMIGFSQAYAHLRPDILVVLGDRFEMHAAAAAAVPFRIPTAHLHGGEITAGAIDDAFRHAITKYSHLHFVATAEYRRRVIQLGEEPWRVVVSGAPGLDRLKTVGLLSREALQERLGIALDQPPLLVTYHPVTLQYEQTPWQIEQLLAALQQRSEPIILSKPNADTSGQIIIRRLEEFAGRRPNALLFDNLGTQGYFSLMQHAAAMVGNSSSGIIEAASFELPVVNIGIRQQGRTRAANVIDVGNSRREIEAGIDRAVDPAFRSALRGLQNPYGSGGAAEIIVDRLKSVQINDSLIVKQFHDLDHAPVGEPAHSFAG